VQEATSLSVWQGYTFFMYRKCFLISIQPKDRFLKILLENRDLQNKTTQANSTPPPFHLNFKNFLLVLPKENLRGHGFSTFGPNGP
jgi:hypothetical protein